MDLNNFGPFNSNTYGSVADYLIIIGTVITIFFIYNTFRYQKRAIVQQKNKDEIDIILSLFLQLDEDMRNFTIQNNTLTGVKSLINYSEKLRNMGPGQSFAAYYNYSDKFQLSYLINSFDIIHDRIESSNLNPKDLKLLTSKLKYYFNSKFETSIGDLARLFANVPIEYTESTEIRNFYNKHTENKHKVVYKPKPADS